jgi:hypothetical protein
MEKSSKLASIVLYVLMAISVVIFVIMFVSIDSETDPSEKARNLMTMNINWSIALFAIAGVLALVFAFIQIITDKAKAISALVAIGLLAVVVIVSYVTASGEIPQFFGVDKFVADGSLTPTISKWIGTGLNVTYILSAGAILAVAGFGTLSIFKR